MDMTQNPILCMKKLMLENIYVENLQFMHIYYIQQLHTGYTYS